MPKVEVERNISVNVDITCESCGHQYQSKAVVRAEQSIWDPFTGNQDLRVKLQRKLAKFNVHDYSELSSLKCPNCGYIQSWNIIGSQKEMAQTVATTIGVIAGIPAFISMVKGSFFGAIIIFGLTAGVVMMAGRVLLTPIMKLVYHPNRKKEAAAEPIFPTITY